MIPFRSRWWWVVVVTVLFVSPLVRATECLTILHFNSLHGQLEGRAARLAALIRGIEKENAQAGCATIVLFGGNAFTGTLLSREFQGKAEIDFLNAIGTDAMVVGNHDFDFGVATLEERIAQATFPVMGGNVEWKHDGHAFALGATVLVVDNLKVGILGLVTEDAGVTTHPENVTALRFQSAHRVAHRLWKLLARTSDIQIALSSQGNTENAVLARTLPELDVIVSGKMGEPTKACDAVREIPLCQTPPYGTYLGRIDLKADAQRVTLLSTKLLSVDAVLHPAEDVQQRVRKYVRDIDRKYGKVVGVTTEKLDLRRGDEFALGNLVADAMRDQTGSDVAFINTGGIRKPLESGPVSLEDLFTVLPFENHLVVMTMTGADLRRTLQFSVRRGHHAVHISGMSVHILERDRIEVMVGDAVLEKKRQYKVATVDFLVSGGDEYGFLRKIASSITPTDTIIRNAVAQYIQKKKRITPPAVGRITTNVPSPLPLSSNH